MSEPFSWEGCFSKCCPWAPPSLDGQRGACGAGGRCLFSDFLPQNQLCHLQHTLGAAQGVQSKHRHGAGPGLPLQAAHNRASWQGEQAGPVPAVSSGRLGTVSSRPALTALRLGGELTPALFPTVVLPRKQNGLAAMLSPARPVSTFRSILLRASAKSARPSLPITDEEARGFSPTDEIVLTASEQARIQTSVSRAKSRCPLSPASCGDEPTWGPGSAGSSEAHGCGRGWACALVGSRP